MKYVTMNTFFELLFLYVILLLVIRNRSNPLVIVTFLFVVILARISFKKYHKKHQELCLEDEYSLVGRLRAMHPKHFEDFIVLLLEINGYSIHKKAGWIRSNNKRNPQKDGGIDIVCHKSGHTTYIQIKKLINKQVSVKTIREMRGVCVSKIGNNDHCTIITTSLFSDDAIEFANEHNIKLIDYKKLLYVIHESINQDEEKRKYLETFFNQQVCTETHTEYGAKNIKVCPKCFAPVVYRKTKNGGFFGCMNFYKTHCTYTLC